MTPDAPSFNFRSFALCYLFAGLCGLTMKDLLTRTFLEGWLTPQLVPLGIASAAFTGFLFQTRWLVWEAPNIPKSNLNLKNKPK
jgi:hypothetical protein